VAGRVEGEGEFAEGMGLAEWERVVGALSGETGLHETRGGGGEVDLAVGGHVVEMGMGDECAGFRRAGIKP
jgi:hypothetical protein